MTIAEIERALARLPRKLLCSFETPVERLYRLEEELNALAEVSGSMPDDASLGSEETKAL